MKNLTLTDIACAIIFWALLIARFGYTFGTGDHVELLPYVLFLKNSTLFQHDFFIQSLHASLPNERTVFAHLLLPFVGHLNSTIFLAHFFNTVLLLLALVKLARRFIHSNIVSWLAVFTSVLVLNNRGLGSVDLYTSSLQASDVACMIGAWGLNLFIERKYTWTAVVMVLATFIHILEGYDLMLLMGIVLAWKWVVNKEVELKQLLYFGAIYLFTAGVYLLFIFRAKTAGTAHIDQQEFFAVMFQFRHPHHYIFSTMPMLNMFLVAIYTSVGLCFYRYCDKTIFQFIAIGTMLLLGYIVCVDILHIVFITNLQWYKIGQWTKFLGIVAIFAYGYDSIKGYLPSVNKSLKKSIIIAGTFIVLFMFWEYHNGLFVQGFKQGNKKEIAVCEKIKTRTSIDAVFVQPFEMTALKFYGQRSSYVDFKAIAKSQKDCAEWYRRIHEVYGLEYPTDRGGFIMELKANQYLNQLNESQWMLLKREGVTHLICTTGNYEPAHLLLLAENGYFVYQL